MIGLDASGHLVGIEVLRAGARGGGVYGAAALNAAD
jgi:hypothetical protein